MNPINQTDHNMEMDTNLNSNDKTETSYHFFLNLNKIKNDNGLFISNENLLVLQNMMEKEKDTLSQIMVNQKNFEKKIDSLFSSLLNKIEKIEKNNNNPEKEKTH